MPGITFSQKVKEASQFKRQNQTVTGYKSFQAKKILCQKNGISMKCFFL